MTKAAKLAGAALAVLFAAAPLAARAQNAPAEVVMHKSDAGWLWTDAKGMSLYTYERDDKPDRSTCNGQCAKNWPPLAAPADAKPAGDWSVVARDDGAMQWAYRGKPLYAYAKDSYAGASFGDGVQDVWHIAFQPIPTPPEAKVALAVAGRVLVDEKGMTLYTHDGADSAGKAACTGACLQLWKPVAAPWTATTLGDWSAVARGDGTKQWAYRGKLLYASHQDIIPGDTNGEGGGWHTAVLDPPAHLPAWVTIRESDMGRVFADAQGLTIYAFEGNIDKVNIMTCDVACVKEYWRPVVASANDKAVANWSVVKTKDGTLQWAYRGNLLYTFVRDGKPGRISGDKFASGYGKSPTSGGWWRPILQTCMCSLTPGS